MTIAMADFVVVIGNAWCDENGKAKGGKAGDSTKKEVRTQAWFNDDWTRVFRPISSDDAESIAKAMEEACSNDNIGYDQSQRTTLFDEAEKVGFEIKEIAKKCETDCSALVAVCCNRAGIPVSKDMYTGNEEKLLKATKKFEILTDKKYLHSSDELKRGDILLMVGHTAIVLTDGSNAKKFEPFLVKVTASGLNVRSGPGTEYGINMVIKDKGIYTIVAQEGKWGKLKSGAGWISLDYTKKV